jgi:hypothetical protein
MREENGEEERAGAGVWGVGRPARLRSYGANPAGLR